MWLLRDVIFREGVTEAYKQNKNWPELSSTMPAVAEGV